MIEQIMKIVAMIIIISVVCGIIFAFYDTFKNGKGASGECDYDGFGWG